MMVRFGEVVRDILGKEQLVCCQPGIGYIARGFVGHDSDDQDD